MKLFHFTNETSAKALFNGSTPKLPFHLTTDLDKGTTYGDHVVWFDIEFDNDDEMPYTVSFVGNNGNGTTNKQSNGMIEYVIRNEKQLRLFFKYLEDDGMNHVMHNDKYKAEQQLREASIKQYKVNKRKLAM